MVIGLAASGRTPFTVEVVKASRAAGALTVGIACNPDAVLCALADHGILAENRGRGRRRSTRMKAGTAQKAILNLLSTQIMLRLGHVHRGLMVDMRPQNIKLRGRADWQWSQLWHRSMRRSRKPRFGADGMEDQARDSGRARV